jgi:hypothetical protein
MRLRPWWGRLSALGAVILTACGMVLAGGTVAAQGSGASLTIDAAHPASTSVHYFVDLRDGDGQPVEGATVTATPTSEDGTEGTPVTLTPAPNPGVYQGSVELSAQGLWTVTFESSEPEASLTHSQDMPAGGQGSVEGEDDDGGGSAVVVVVAGIVVVALLAFGAWALLGNRRRPPSAVASDGSPPSEAGPSGSAPG